MWLFFSCVVSSDLEPCSQLENNGPHAQITNKRFPYNEEKVETWEFVEMWNLGIPPNATPYR